MAGRIALGVLTIIFASVGWTAASDEKRLTSHLMADYKARSGDAPNAAPPTYSVNETLTVNFGMGLIEADIDTDLRVLRSKVFLRYMWQDAYLRWDPKDFGGVTLVRVPISSIWQPDLKLYNSYDLKMEVDDSALALVYNSGTVMWVPPAVMRSKCQLVSGHVWNCTQKIGSWTFDGLRLDPDFYNQQKDIDVTDFNIAQWELVEHSAVKNVKYYPCCPEPYPRLEFNMAFRRHYS